MGNISVTQMGDYLLNWLTKTEVNKQKTRCGESVLYWYTSDVLAMTSISSWTVTKDIDKYVSISTDGTGALKVQTETYIQVNYEAQYVLYSKFSLR